jgi:hypothetical protein
MAELQDLGGDELNAFHHQKRRAPQKPDTLPARGRRDTWVRLVSGCSNRASGGLRAGGEKGEGAAEEERASAHRKPPWRRVAAGRGGGGAAGLTSLVRVFL